MRLWYGLYVLLGEQEGFVVQAEEGELIAVERAEVVVWSVQELPDFAEQENRIGGRIFLQYSSGIVSSP